MPRNTVLSLTAAALAGATLALPAAAQDATLTVYTYDSFTADWGPGPLVEEAFEAECGCDIAFVTVADGVAMLNRVRLEGENTDADIVLGLDTNLMQAARETGLFAPHDIALDRVDVPGGWDDATFVPYDYGYFAFMYDTEAIDTPPQSLAELVAAGPELKIAIQDPRTSTPGLGLLLWMKAVFGDEAADAWAALEDNVLTVTPGWSESYGLFTQGEVPMVLSYTTSTAYHRIAEGTDRYAAAAFEEGHYLQIELAARTVKAADNPLAAEFLAFMTGPGFQDAIPETNWMYPAGEISEPLDPAFSDLVEPAETLILSPETVAENRKAWIDEWLAVMSR
ncbi:thiamine ABC transporter substrate binding subunit [Aquibium sp. A9E412]|uniref:thiamine ABC transporter substrate binding subunit n=1 Tax=Aquibium sp. A9E412 TaxID=2976767 RepID=UPI0025B10883|nr:thiamine ABC transporter substrate binding subunit [Aquibium sp. A9E412]MDN2567230.1 thiamine ABC transporter substrate binding subunit [Aquibium sp. A9E412]